MTIENLMTLLSLKNTYKIASEIPLFSTYRNVVKPTNLKTSTSWAIYIQVVVLKKC